MLQLGNVTCIVDPQTFNHVLSWELNKIVMGFCTQILHVNTDCYCWSSST